VKEKKDVRLIMQDKGVEGVRNNVTLYYRDSFAETFFLLKKKPFAVTKVAFYKQLCFVFKRF
jgi:hypothetical protein